MDQKPILELKNIRKVFGTTVALDSVSLTIFPGEIHGLLGGNGAGKTTLMNILYGLYTKDEGEIIVNGTPLTVKGPKDAIQNGIGMVHQHFLQINNYTVLENIVLGTDVSKPNTMDLSAEREKLVELGHKFGLSVEPDAVLDTLPIGSKQKVEILKALYRGVKVLILDEPTTNLTPQEVDDLFQSLRLLVTDGLSIVFITHKLREVLRVCDRITVLRLGKNITTMTRAEASEEVFVRAMVGDQMNIEGSVYFSGGVGEGAKDRSGQKPALELKNIGYSEKGKPDLVKGMNLQIYPDEILGVAGVAGNGQRYLAELVTGVLLPTEGTIEINGEDVTRDGINARLHGKIAYIPEDRLHDGYLPKASVAHNLILGYHDVKPYSNGTFIDWKTVYDNVRRNIVDYNIKTSGPDAPGGELSGGNIQRVMIARSLAMPSEILLAHNPTRGLDIPSMDLVYSKLLERKKAGHGTLLISEDLDELLLMSDRIAVIYRNQILDILSKEEFDKYRIGQLMSGIKESQTEKAVA